MNAVPFLTDPPFGLCHQDMPVHFVDVLVALMSVAVFCAKLRAIRGKSV